LNSGLCREEARQSLVLLSCINIIDLFVRLVHLVHRVLNLVLIVLLVFVLVDHIVLLDMTLFLIDYIFLVIMIIVQFNYIFSTIILYLYSSTCSYSTYSCDQMVSGRYCVSVVLIHYLPADAPYIPGHQVVDRGCDIPVKSSIVYSPNIGLVRPSFKARLCPVLNPP
jgi:hypothetical protein